MQGISVKSVVQKGLGENARLVMVVHPANESSFSAALEFMSSSTSSAHRRGRSG